MKFGLIGRPFHDEKLQRRFSCGQKNHLLKKSYITLIKKSLGEKESWRNDVNSYYNIVESSYIGPSISDKI